MTMTTSPMSTGQLPRFPARMLSSIAPEEALVLHGLLRGRPRASVLTPVSGRGRRDAGHLRRHAGRDRLDDLLLRRLGALVDGDAAAEPQDGDPRRDLEDVVQVVRDQDDREPLVGEPLDELEHLLRLRRRRAPRSARRGSRGGSSTSPRGRPRPTAAGRPRASPPAGGSSEIVVTARLFIVSAVFASITGSLSRWKTVVGLAAEVHVLDDVEVVAEREILVDDLDPELRRVLRPVDVDLARRRRRPRRCPASGCRRRT